MKNILFFFVFLFLNSNFAATQIHTCCGTSPEDFNILTQRLLHERQSSTNPIRLRTDLKWIPIQFHVVTNSDQTNRADVMEIYDLVCELNMIFMNYDIQFFIADDFNFIASTDANNSQAEDSIQDLFISQKDSNAINIFVVKTIDGGYLGKYEVDIDGIILDRNEANDNGALLLSHLLGHFFNLLPTYHGWENEFYNPTIHGFPPPEISPSGVPTEKMDSSNCMDAGDFICDTKPNYTALWGLNNCEINFTIYDPDSVLLEPDVDNFMSGTLDCNPIYTSEQQVIIHTNLMTRDLAIDISPDVSPFSNPPNLLSPINGEITPAYNIVGLDWEDVPDATSYIVEVDRTSNFTFAPKIKFVTGGSYVEFEDIFEPDEIYYWRVKALKDGNVCGEVLGSQFKTGLVSNTNRVDKISNFDVFPNPLNGEKYLNIEMETNQEFNAKIKIYNITNQIIQERNVYFDFGKTNFKLNIEDLTAGIYIVSIETKSGFLNKKIAVN